jgi:uncharacterized protein with HEPN domain
VSKPWQPYAHHILDAIGKIRRIEQRGDITTDEVLHNAVLRNLQTQSEATQLLPEELKAAHPQIPWKQISGFRNILAHNYLGDLDPQTIARVVREHLTLLEASIRATLATQQGEP